MCPEEDNQARGSFRPNVCSLYDRPPFLNLGPVEGSERLWRLLLAREHLLPEVREPLAHGRISQRLNERGVELGDDGLGSALGSPEAEPGGHMQPRDTGFVHRRNVPCRWQP